LSWFLRVASLLYAKTTPIPRIVATQRRSGQALKVKPMLDGRLRRKKIHIKAIINYVNLKLVWRLAIKEKQS